MAKRSAFVRKSEVDEVDLGDGNIVVIKRRITAQEDAQIDTYAFSTGMTGALENGGQQAELKLAADPGAWNIARLLVYVTAWRGEMFEDEDGELIPCTPENIRALDSRVSDKVLKEITARAAGLGDEEAKVSAGT